MLPLGSCSADYLFHYIHRTILWEVLRVALEHQTSLYHIACFTNITMTEDALREVIVQLLTVVSIKDVMSSG